jgi:DNA-binding NtrC family response regulator
MLSETTVSQSPRRFKKAEHRILVVEDDPEMRALLVQALGAAKRVINEAADGGDAIERLNGDLPYDLVVSDVKMPNRDGHAVLREVVSNHAETKVVLITAFGDVEEYLETMDGGAFEYLTKPLKMVDLVRVVDRALAV